MTTTLHTDLDRAGRADTGRGPTTPLSPGIAYLLQRRPAASKPRSFDSLLGL